jgi:N-6 DNA Methylase
MALNDPNAEWIGNVQPVGLVVAPAVLARLGLNPAEQTRADSEAVRALLSGDDDGPALPDPWAFFTLILGWRAKQVAGAPSGPALPDTLRVHAEESDTDLVPHWAVTDPDNGSQILVRIEGPGIKPEGRRSLTGWEATPHQQLERLLRETGVPTGILFTDNELRVIHAPRGETSGWLRFPLRPLGDVGGRPMLGGLKLILSSFRLHNDALERRLPALLKASRDAQAEVSKDLAAQVLGALHELLRGLHEADRARIEALAATQPEHLYDGLLAVLLRLVFLLYAEDRDLIPSRDDAEARALYDKGYGVRTLHARLLDDAANHPDTMKERRGAWSRLLALFRLVHRGDGTGWIRGRRGQLFDPEAFPFLQGQDTSADPPAPAAVSDECILNILDKLLTLDGERLSYRTLDVEQIGSVYETVMGFTVETRPGPALAIRAGKNNKTPVFVDVAALAAAKKSDRAKFLKENADRNALPDKVSKALAAAADAATVKAALQDIVDERGSPGGDLSAPGTPLLQPTHERRRTGSHYTPRTLTAPIVEHALDPAFARIGEDTRPEAVLDLKVCDPAMGSGAFLVEACRLIATRLVKAWEKHKDTRPVIPLDEDEHLHARRLVAQRCIYGVDRNPRAVDLARLSMWLVTLARDHEFTFLDHALKCGDSLVGLTLQQIKAAHWETSDQLTFIGQLVNDHLKAAEMSRERIRDRADWATEDELRPLLKAADKKLEVARLIGDGVVCAFFHSEQADARLIGDSIVSAFFHSEKPKERMRRLAELQTLIQNNLGSREWANAVELFAAWLRKGEYPIPPFHWSVEFPEVFDRENGGFDAIVGNPPFAGKNTIIAGHRKKYIAWLKTLHQNAHGNADLVAHFFRRAFGLLRRGGVLGLIATNTIGQGDTRSSGLSEILRDGGSILRCRRRLKWPGEAAVVVSVVHVIKDIAQHPILDDRRVQRISAYLVEGDLDTSPAALSANNRKAFIGSYVLGMGFTFDDEAAAKGEAESLKRMNELIEREPHNAERIFPYIGGEEVNTDPRHRHHRYIIDFSDFPIRREWMETPWDMMTADERAECFREGVMPHDYPDAVAADWPNLLEIVERRVKPQRLRQKDKIGRKIWWRFLRRRDRLYTTISKLDYVFATTRVSPHLAISQLGSAQVFSDQLVPMAFSNFAPFAVLQSRVHELWARFFSSSMKDDLRYTPSDCFRTFPFPDRFESDGSLEIVGDDYHSLRAELMINRNEGLTKTYNRFHARNESAHDIARLRQLHADMDRAVLRAYAWNDLADRATPEFIEQEADEGKKPKTRLDWPVEFKDEVFSRLLALNAARAADERASGVTTVSDVDEQEEDEIDEEVDA